MLNIRKGIYISIWSLTFMFLFIFLNLFVETDHLKFKMIFKSF